MDPYDVFQRLALTIIIVLCSYYICLVVIDRFVIPKRNNAKALLTEGFSDSPKGDIYNWLTADKIYDSFYANIYDQLASHGQRMQMQIADCLLRWKRTPVADIKLLDVGCGSGIATRILMSKGVGKICGLDSSPAMLKKAKDMLVASKVPVEKAATIEYRLGDMTDIATCKTGEFTHATMFYFSVYYAKDKDALFKNLYTWIAPGGYLMVEMVNKYKFDPMLQAAAPFVGFSLQKYTKDRFNKSKISFNEFNYESEFILLEEGDKSEAAEFREVIEFKKTGVIRRQKHQLWMPELKDILKSADKAGWVYKGYKDMLSMGFEYSYMLYFEHQ